MIEPGRRRGHRSAELTRIGLRWPADGGSARRRLSNILVFFALFALFMAVRWPFAWTANEENYFQLGHRLVSPGDYGPLHAVFDASKARWVGLAAFGILSELIGFEWAHRVLGLAVAVAISGGIASVAGALRLGLVPTLSAVLLFLACRQSVVGGEWFIGSIEPKGFAYAVSLFGFAAAMGRRVILSAVLVASAGYLHFQVGLLWVLFTLAFLVAGAANRRNMIFKFAATVGFLLIPLLALIAHDAFAHATFVPAPGYPPPDIIYSMIRAPHHVAPFSTVGGWPDDAIAASLVAFLIIAVALAGARQSTDQLLSRFLVGLSAVAVLLPVAVLMSWVDRDSAWMGKLYPFRVASPLLLLALLGWAALLREVGSSAQKRFAWGVAISGCLVHIAATRSGFVSPPQDGSWSGAIGTVQRATEPGETVIIDPAFDGMTSNSLPRLLDRPTVVSWKFVPTAPSDIQRWYGLIKWRDTVIENGCPPPAGVGAMILTLQSARRMRTCSHVIYSDPAVTVLDLNSN